MLHYIPTSGVVASPLASHQEVEGSTLWQLHFMPIGSLEGAQVFFTLHYPNIVGDVQQIVSQLIVLCNTLSLQQSHLSSPLSGWSSQQRRMHFASPIILVILFSRSSILRLSFEAFCSYSPVWWVPGILGKISFFATILLTPENSKA